jgi:serine/threonine protein kinase
LLRTKTFGHYEILRKLGRGMTDVYLAFDHQANRQAVLKIVEESPDSLTQLVMQAERRGAELQRQLRQLDPRILEVYEFGDLDGYFFLAMEYVEGRTVAQILQAEKCIDPERAARYMGEVCSQLHRLHSFHADIDGQRRAVVHGDIKPSNIQIGNEDEVRLLDFGIAKAITFTHNLTHHNLGSPSYCSPERLSRGQVDLHADLWAVGVTLYEMVAGGPPYQARDTRKLENLIQSRRPPRALPDTCPRALQAIIRKALAGDIQRRYLSAAAFESDLKLFSAGEPTVAEREPRAAWNSNATVEKARDARTSPPTIASSAIALKSGWSKAKTASALSVLSALCWGLFAGLLVFVPTGIYYFYWKQSAPLRANLDFTHKTIAQMQSDWNLYQHLRAQNRFLGPLSPVEGLHYPFKSNLSTAADEILDGYRSSNDPVLEHVNWPKAQWCLERLLDLDNRDRGARGKLLVATGFQKIIQSEGQQPDDADFREAATLLPRAPDPHLGLAWIYAYGEKNAGKAVAELEAADRLGFALGSREKEEEADAYRFRALEELEQARKAHDPEKRTELSLAQRDLDRARQLYEPIAGFSQVSLALRQVNDSEREREQLSQPPAPPAPTSKPKQMGRRLPLRRRWR